MRRKRRERFTIYPAGYVLLGLILIFAFWFVVRPILFPKEGPWYWEKVWWEVKVVLYRVFGLEIKF